jgi:hypothetical protein
MWWEHYKSMQPPEYEISWEEFKKAFRDHHLPKALTDRKMRELLALKQGSDTVYQYAQKFNNLCQYGGYHVDTDMKKMELFREGLNSKLAKWLNLVKFDSYPMLVNKAISQEDAMKRAQAEKKRKANSMPDNAQHCKIRIMRKTFPDFQQASQSETSVAKLSQERTQENLHLPNTQQLTPKPIVPSPNGSNERRCFKCGEPGHFMPPCGLHLTPLATGSLERILLVFSTPGGLTGDDHLRLFFTCTNTSQAAQHCQSLITPGSDHPLVLEPHMVLNLPLDECIDNTHI